MHVVFSFYLCIIIIVDMCVYFLLVTCIYTMTVRLSSLVYFNFNFIIDMGITVKIIIMMV